MSNAPYRNTPWPVLKYWPKTIQANPTQQLFNKQLPNGEQLARRCAGFLTDLSVFNPNSLAQKVPHFTEK